MNLIETKQPRGLYILFPIELWERFGFYCIQALLVLFLTKAYHFTDAKAYDLYSAFSALIYATPVLGGYLADRLLGFRRAMLLGTVAYGIGYFSLATTSPVLFYPALAFLICGNGLFKSSVSSLLGTFYKENDPRRDSGFTIFYMGINIGALTSPIICTWIAMTFGWGYGFAAAGLGMIICISINLLFSQQLAAYGLPPNPERLTHKLLPGISVQTAAMIATLIFVDAFSLLIRHAEFTNYLFNFFGIAVFVTLLIFAFRYSGQQQQKLIALITLVFFAIIFWSMYFQVFSSITLFADRVVNRHLFGWEIPTGMLVSTEGFFVVALAPLAAMLWLYLKRKKCDFSFAGKFSLGLTFISSAFLLLSLGVTLAGTKQVPLFWLILTYLLFACGELSLSAIALSMITALAPRNLIGMLMGVWFLSFSFGFTLGDHLVKLTSIPTTLVDPIKISHLYGQVFAYQGWTVLGIALLLACLAPKIRRLAGESS